MTSDNGTVTVCHGDQSGRFDVKGEQIEAVRNCLVDAFGIPEQAVAFVNGKQEDATYMLRASDDLEFLNVHGRKGMNRMFSQVDIRRDYMGVPIEVLDDLFATFPHDDTTADGEPIWLESSVDRWLAERYARKWTDDECDKVVPPTSVRIDGKMFKVRPKEWRLLEVLLLRGTVEIGAAIEHVWGHHAEPGDNAVKQQIKHVNETFANHGCRATITQENGFVTFSK